MAVDKKSQHVGNHGGVYTDIDGMTKQFTVIDHDKKVSIIGGINDKLEKGWEKKYRATLVERITELPASLCHEWFHDFTVRGEGKSSVTWNMNMLLDSGVPMSQLRDLCTMLENRADIIKLIP